VKKLDFCPVCGSHNVLDIKEIGWAPQVIYEIMPGVEVYAAVISHYYKCTGCSLIFQNPRMSDEELNKFYSQGYYRWNLNLSDEEMDKGEKYRAGIDAGIIKKHVGNVDSHLDVGCGRGYLLEAIWAKTKVGVDENTDWETVEGIKIYNKIDQVPTQFFDLVTAIHVLEHVPAPLDYLKKLAKFLKKDGFLVIEVPTWKSPGGSLRLAHLSHFEPDVLRLMCKQVGLKVVQTEFTPHLMLICQKNQS